MQTLPGNGEADSWALLPPYDWQPLGAADALAYVTDALPADVTIAGPGSVDLWLRSSATDTDVQVTLSEVRPDDLETYVQSGWLRASHRKLDKKTSGKFDPRPTHLEGDSALLPAGEFSLARVEIFPSAHVFRAGLADPDQHRGARRRPHALGVRHAAHRRRHHERRVAHRRAGVEARAPGRPERLGARGAAAVPVAARAAVPRLRGGGQRRLTESRTAPSRRRPRTPCSSSPPPVR